MDYNDGAQTCRIKQEKTPLRSICASLLYHTETRTVQDLEKQNIIVGHVALSLGGDQVKIACARPMAVRRSPVCIFLVDGGE